MERSRKTITPVFWPYLGLILVLGVITIAAALPFGLGLPIAVPVCLAAQYRFYRRLNPVDPVSAGAGPGPAVSGPPGQPVDP
jgi:hypothetical protein